MIDIKIKPYRQDIIELLSGCMFGDEQKILNELNKYEIENGRLLTGEVVDHELVGLIGLKYDSIEISIALLHIAVKPQYQRNGIGKKMIFDHLVENKIRIIEAETDNDAVDFYRKIGFRIQSLGEKYPGIERFNCTLKYD